MRSATIPPSCCRHTPAIFSSPPPMPLLPPAEPTSITCPTTTQDHALTPRDSAIASALYSTEAARQDVIPHHQLYYPHRFLRAHWPGMETVGQLVAGAVCSAANAAINFDRAQGSAPRVAAPSTRSGEDSPDHLAELPRHPTRPRRQARARPGARTRFRTRTDLGIRTRGQRRPLRLRAECLAARAHRRNDHPRPGDIRRQRRRGGQSRADRGGRIL